MAKMTSRERILAAIRRKDVDYVPCAPSWFPLTWQQRVGRRWQFPWGPSKREEVEYSVQQLGVDHVLCAWNTLNKFFPNPEVTSRVWAEGDKIHKVWITPSGQLHAAIRYDEHWPHGFDIPFFDDFISHFVEPWLKTKADVQCLRHIFLHDPSEDQLAKLRFEVAEQKALAERLGLATYTAIGHGLTSAMWFFLAEPLCLKMMDEPELIDAYLALEHKFNLRNMELAIDLGIDIIRRNGYYETTDFYSPQMLEKFLAKYLREEIKMAHQAERLIIYRLHTGVTRMLDWISSLDFDGIVDLNTSFADVDLVKINEKLGSKMSFWTGPCQTHHMWSDDTDVVRRAVRQVFDVFGKKGLIIKACPSVHSTQPWKNTLAMIDEWKKLR
jgi:hypothetical protein